MQTLQSILVEKVSRDFLDGAITFGAIAILPTDIQMKVHCRIMKLTDMYQRIDEQRQKAETCFRSCERSSSDQQSVYNDVAILDDAYLADDGHSFSSAESNAPLGHLYPPGTRLELVSVNGSGKYVKVKVTVTYAELTQREKDDLLIIIDDTSNDDNIPNFIKAVHAATDSNDESKDRKINDIINIHGLKVVRTTYHPFYVVYDNPLEDTSKLQLKLILD
jgi:hypothetical protein